MEYKTRRGKMVVAKGKEFQIAWPFTGIIPLFPLPKDSEFRKDVLANFINRWGDELLKKPEQNRQGGDTYWGGKSMLKTCQAFNMAWQLQLPIAKDLYKEAKRVVEDWLTYDPGEKAFYYARYPLPWSGLVGFNPSYGSEQFTDNHFHYGYLAMSAALIGMHDPVWLKKHGPSVTEVVKQYAEWKRDSTRFPRLRTFECWAGHSYAGGMSSEYDGNNQESSSEAVGSWAGMFFLGAALGDQEMLATGAMGYAIETEAVHEYWNNSYGWKDPEQSNWSPNYKPTICSVMRDRDMGAWTWFSGEPIHIYGIQWLPAWTHMNYFGAHAEHSIDQLDQMLIRQGKGKGKLSWEKIDGDWGQVTAAYAAFSQPEEICRVLDQAMEKNWKIASPKHAGIPYYLAHASRAYGLIDKESHTDLPTSVVLKKADGTRTALVYNLLNEPKTVTIYVKGKIVLQGKLPAKVLMAVPLK
jgi:endoglucanase Acf2